MIRKLMMVAAAIAIPISGAAVATVATVGTSGVAGAVQPNIKCNIVGETVTFATPGISLNGSFTTATTSATNTSATTADTCKVGSTPETGSSKASTISTSTVGAATTCTGVNTPVHGCTTPPPQYYSYDSTASYASSGSGLVVPTQKFKINGVTYKLKTTTTAAIVPDSGPCGLTSGEGGFSIKGTLTAPATYSGDAFKLTACLAGDSGTDTTNNFTNDFNSASGGNASIVIATATLDSTTSLLKITG